MLGWLLWAALAEDFGNLFKRRFTCCSKVTVTDGLSVAKSKTVTKADGGIQPAVP